MVVVVVCWPDWAEPGFHVDAFGFAMEGIGGASDFVDDVLFVHDWLVCVANHLIRATGDQRRTDNSESQYGDSSLRSE